MSGGSFDYLFDASTADLFDGNRRDSLHEMVAELRRLGHDEAAQATESLLSIIEVAHTEVETKAGKLRAIWKAAEWNRSGDWDEGDVAQAVEAYRKKQSE